MRKANWPVILAEQVEAARSRPFAYGSHDCATWSFDIRNALTGGENPADNWRGRYTTELGCARTMRKLGWRDVEDMGRKLLGNPIAPLMAQRGDILLADGAFGICLGAAGAFIGENGIVAKSLRECVMAWRV